jgi:hypothetical protein
MMSVFLDGRLLSAEDPGSGRMSSGARAIVPLDEVVDINAVTAIEIYASAANAPAELIPLTGAATQGACGIVAIWTGGRH